MPVIHTLISLVSEQPDPNFFTCIDSTFKPQNLYLLVTPQMKEQANNLEKALREIKSIHQIEIPKADDILLVMETIEGVIGTALDAINVEKGEEILVNITCGTKLMSIAAFSAAQSWGVRSIYVSIAQNQKVKAFILSPRKDSKDKNLLPDIQEINLSLPENYIKKYLIAHGCELTKKDPKWNNLTDKERAFVEFALNNSQGRIKNERFIGKLNLILFSQDPKNRRNRDLQKTRNQGWNDGPQKFLLDKENDPGFEEFLRTLDSMGWISLDNQITPNEFVIQSEEDFDFLHGRWLEKYIAEFIRELYPDIQPYNLEVKINNGENQNEIDVAFVKGRQLFAIEVKTSNLNEDIGGEKQNILHKLEAVSRQIGGINSKKCLVSYRTILGNGKRNNKYSDPNSKKTEYKGNNFLGLAHQKKITVIQGLEVCNKQTLQKKLREWIEHDDV